MMADEEEDFPSDVGELEEGESEDEGEMTEETE